VSQAELLLFGSNPLATLSTLNYQLSTTVSLRYSFSVNWELLEIPYWELLKTSGTQSSRLHIAYKKGRRDACVPKKISF
jgi:hypothetical protein